MFGRLGLPLPPPRVLKRPLIRNDTGTPGVMIRKFPSDQKTTMRAETVSPAYAYAAALAVALALAIPATEAYGQSGYLSRDPNVRVDMSVLEELGPRLTVPGQFLQNNPVARPPVQFPPSTAPVSRLTGPLLNRRITVAPAPAPRRRLSAAPPPRAGAPAPAPRRRLSAAPPPKAAPPPAVVQTPAPAVPPPAPTPTPEPAVVEVPAAAPAAEPPTAAPPTPVPPVPVPPPAPAIATADPAPATAAEPPAPPAQQQAPKPPASSTAESPAAAVQTASRPDADGKETSIRVLFDDKSAKIADSARAPLQKLSDTMKKSENLRVQLMAYAGGTSETASQARRLSLSRALAVRSFLINQGVRSTRMDVRALGNKAEGGPSDRVDAVLVER